MANFTSVVGDSSIVECQIVEQTGSALDIEEANACTGPSFDVQAEEGLIAGISAFARRPARPEGCVAPGARLAAGVPGGGLGK